MSRRGSIAESIELKVLDSIRRTLAPNQLVDATVDTFVDDAERVRVVVDTTWFQLTKGELIVGIWAAIIAFNAREIYEFAKAS